MDEERTERDSAKGEEMAALSGEVLAGAAGAALGSFAGPIGAIAGGAVGPVLALALSHVAVDINRRLISVQEERRIAATLATAADAAAQESEAGSRLRGDDFFKAKPGARSPMEEFGEGALLAAQREYQEKKIPLIGRLLGRVPFHEELDEGDALLILSLAQELSWRQLCFLSLFGNDALQLDVDVSTIPAGRQHALQIELEGLMSRELIILPGGGVKLGVPDVQFDYELNGLGKLLYDYLGLGEIATEDIGAAFTGRRHDA